MNCLHTLHFFKSLSQKRQLVNNYVYRTVLFVLLKIYQFLLFAVRKTSLLKITKITNSVEFTYFYYSKISKKW